MTTYQRKGGQYRTRSGATAYRRGVKGQRAKPTVRRTARRFYRKHTVPCLVVGGLGLILAWHAAPLLVLAGAGMLAAPYVAAGVKRAGAGWQQVRRAPAAWEAKRAQWKDEWKASGDALAAGEARWAARRARVAPPGHPYTPGRPPLFLCGTCNEPHRKRTAA